jgi:hypothetical protein
MRVCPDSLFFKVAIRLASGIASLALLLFSGTASAVDDSWFFLRNHNPFLQVYGLPPFQTASLADEGELQYRATFDVANHADSGELQNETVIIDGESYFFTLSVRHGLKRWLEVGFDLPVVRHSGGMFDNAIAAEQPVAVSICKAGSCALRNVFIRVGAWRSAADGGHTANNRARLRWPSHFPAFESETADG